MRRRDRERLEDLEAAIRRLRWLAEDGIVVVEGRRDVRALRRLGIDGDMVMVHQGQTLDAVVDRLAEQAKGRTAILLVDWDRTGGRLFRRLHDGLRGRVAVDTECRRRIALASHQRCLEDIPAERAALRRRAEDIKYK